MKKIFFQFCFFLGLANLSAQVWTQVGSDIDGEAAGDQSSWSISQSVDGKRLAIGAYNNDDNGTDAGHVRVYEENGGTWTQLGSDLDGEAGADQSGYAVSLCADGKRLAIGARLNDGNFTDSGHVRVYEENGGVWTQLGGDINGEALEDWFGSSVSYSDDGKRLAIGAPRNDSNGNDAGHVRVYSESGGVWTQVGGDINGESTEDRSGYSISMSANGKKLAIGGWLNDGNGTNSGHVRVYEESGGIWTQQGCDIDGGAADDPVRLFRFPVRRWQQPGDWYLA